MNPYALLAIVLAVGAMTGGAYWQGRKDGSNAELATQKREEDVARVAGAAAAASAADAISKLEVQRVEITQPVLREVREKLVYRECKHSADGLRGVNAALTGISEPAGSSKLPATSEAHR